MDEGSIWKVIFLPRLQRTLVLYGLLGCCVLLDCNTVLSDNQSQSVPSVLVFTSLINPPFLEKKEGFEGFIPDLVKKIALRLSTPYTLKLVAWGGYGVKQTDGSWNGMVGEVLRGEADVAAGALSIVPSRKEVVDFTIPFMQAGIATIISKPPPGSDLPITHPRELVNQSDIKYGCIPGSLTYQFFKTTNDTTYRQMWQTMLKFSEMDDSVFAWTSAAGVQRVRESKGKYVFFLESTFAEYLVNQRPCDLMMLDEFLNPTDYAFAVQKNSRLKKRINNAIQTLLDNGVVDRFRERWWKEKCRRSGQRRRKLHTKRPRTMSPERAKTRRKEQTKEPPPPPTKNPGKPTVQKSRTRSVWRNRATSRGGNGDTCLIGVLILGTIFLSLS